MDAPSAQLHQEIRDAVTRQLHQRRPLLHHLNADTSWLLQIPRPVTATKRGGRAFYNILIDPWLAGGQSDVASWFSQQWHRYESACKNIAEVEWLAREVEILASGLRLGMNRQPNGEEAGVDIPTFIDAVAISHEFTDHCHKETLAQVDPNVPVFATELAARIIRNMKHFHHVETIAVFSRSGGSSSSTDGSGDWRAASIPPLPEWLSIFRLQEETDNVFSSGNIYYHSALVFAFAIPPAPQTSSTTTTRSSSSSSRSLPNGWIPPPSSSTFDRSSDADDDDPPAECIIYTPHGVRPGILDPIVTASPRLSVLALVHGLHDVSLDAMASLLPWGRKLAVLKQLNLGGANGLEVQRATRAKYWIGTHDEPKWAMGLVAWLLRRRVVGVEEALRREKEELVGEGAKAGVDGESVERLLDEWPRYEEVGNGESRMLL